MPDSGNMQSNGSKSVATIVMVACLLHCNRRPSLLEGHATLLELKILQLISLPIARGCDLRFPCCFAPCPVLSPPWAILKYLLIEHPFESDVPSTVIWSSSQGDSVQWRAQKCSPAAFAKAVPRRIEKHDTRHRSIPPYFWFVRLMGLALRLASRY
ncbi:hypothetical protein BDV19DRAFT_355578 [Aspergillus venezuelensis]